MKKQKKKQKIFFAEELWELSKEYKGARCSRYCSIWDDFDKDRRGNERYADCDIYGENHLSPSRCTVFLTYELERRK